MNKFLMLMILCGSFVGTANAQSVRAVKVFDGKAVGCDNESQAQTTGFLIRDVNVQHLAENKIKLQMTPQFLLCVAKGTQSRWTEVSERQLAVTYAQDFSGQEYVIRVEAQYLIANTLDNRYFVGTDLRKNINASVELDGVLSAAEQQVLESTGQVSVALDLSLRGLVSTSTGGEIIYLRNHFSGSFRVVVQFKKENGVVRATVRQL